jgi:hypothetical protein
MKANKGELDFDQAIKTISDNVRGAGALVSMHIMTVLTLSGNCLNRDFLRNATLGEACKKQVRELIFQDKSVSAGQMKTAMNSVIRNMGLSAFMVENLLCEAMRPKEGFDTFHPSQSIFFLEKDTDNIVCVRGDDAKSRSVEDDKRALQDLPCTDGVDPLYPWWQAASGKEEIHLWFVQLREKRNMDPASVVIRPHLNGKVLLSEKEIWKEYIQRVDLKQDDRAKPKQQVEGKFTAEQKKVRKKRKIVTGTSKV